MIQRQLLEGTTWILWSDNNVYYQYELHKCYNTYLVIVRLARLKLVLRVLIADTISRDLEPVNTG